MEAQEDINGFFIRVYMPFKKMDVDKTTLVPRTRANVLAHEAVGFRSRHATISASKEIIIATDPSRPSLPRETVV